MRGAARRFPVSALLRHHAAVAAVLLSAACAACASGRSGGASFDRSVLTQEQMLSQHFENAYDAISSLRGNWLVERGADSFASPSKVQVYIDNVRLGEVETLRTIPVSAVALIRHYDALQANARFGIGHGAGVIQIDSYAGVKKP